MAPLGHGLPDEIVIWEILVRLPPKPLLRCRAVCRTWRHDTSTREFLLAHHDHQPSLPLLRRSRYGNNATGDSLDIIPYDHQEVVVDADQLQPVARFGAMGGLILKASCEGLLLICTYTIQFFICNPTTRECACLPMLHHKVILGMYRHPPTGEYRILFFSGQHGCYFFVLGSVQPPRHVEWPAPPERDLVAFNGVSLLFRGSLHWNPLMRGSGSMIVAFDTIGETFRLIHAPLVPNHAQLFEMDGMLGISSFNDATSVVDIWTMQDYESGVWAFKCRVKLPLVEIKVQSGKVNPWSVKIIPRDGKLPMLVQFDKWLLEVDLDSRLVACLFRERLILTQHRLKQTLVSHPFFPKLDGYVVDGSPFITLNNYML